MSVSTSETYNQQFGIFFVAFNFYVRYFDIGNFLLA